MEQVILDPLNRSTIKKGQVLSNPVLGMMIFIFTEIMIFASLLSAFTIVKSGFTNWPPMGQPRLPIMMTAINSLFLLASGWCLDRAYKYFVDDNKTMAVKNLFLAALALGILFVAIQGAEWVHLLGYGLTMTQSLYGAFFYLIIGVHALHVLGATLALTILYQRLRQGRLKKDMFAAMRLFWFFVVGVWPVLYGMVYL